MATPVGGKRKLTTLEEGMVTKIFGNSIDCSKVWVRNKKWGFFSFLLSDRVTVTPDGTLYCGPVNFKEDFATSSPNFVHHFIHEMVHVWQYQLGYQVMGQGVASVFGYGYDYTLKPDSKLSDFPMEGQANIIADYAMYDLGLNSKAIYSSRADFKKAPYSFQELQNVLKDFLANPGDIKNLPNTNNETRH
jgi:hypothetical protein